jgi:ATP-dependent DNA helicase RecG
MSLTQTVLNQRPGQNLAFLPNPRPEAIAETLIALANAEGGTVVLGMSPDGKLGDLYVVEEAQEALQAATRLCRPPVPTGWQMEELAEGLVVLLRVERGSEMHKLWDGRILVRKGIENHLLETAEASQLANTRTDGDFETQLVPGASRDDLDDDVIDDYMERRQERSPRSSVLPKDRLLQQIGALGEGRAPTVSGLLLFGKEPQFFMPQTRR